MSTPNRNLLLRLFPLLALLIFVACGSAPIDPIIGPNAEITGLPTDNTVVVGTEITLSGETSSDDSGTNLEYAWSVDAPDGSAVEGVTGVDETFSFVPDVAGGYVVTLTVTDDEGNTDTATATITAVEPGTGPGEVVSTEGEGSLIFVNGPELAPGVTTYNWTLDAPEGSTASLDDSTNPVPSFRANVTGEYSVTLQETGETFTYIVTEDTTAPVVESIGVSDSAGGAKGPSVTPTDGSFELGTTLSDNLGLDSADGGLTLQLRSDPDDDGVSDFNTYFRVDTVGCTEPVRLQTGLDLGFTFLPENATCNYSIDAVDTAPAGDYTFRVIARDGAGNRTSSGTVTVTIPPAA